MAVCPQCGQQNADDARSCSGCAAPLGLEIASAREVRKVVTVLFSDVVDSTPLGERLDAESLRRVMARWHDAMRTVLERHGGTVEKFVGDAVMAVFGIPQAHEDDALRAVRAAVDMRVALAALNTEFTRDYAVELDARTALNTGEVVSGRGETLVTGDAVNVAARLEQAAQAGEILIGEQTLGLVQELALVEPVAELALKGKARPVGAWRLLGVLPDVPAFVRPIATPFVGRRRELALLEQAFERAQDERRCELVTVLGQPGIGKSRLLREFVATVADRSRVVVGRCLPYGEGITYWPLVEIVKEIGADDPKGTLSALLAGEERGELVAGHVAAAAGLSDAVGSRDETQWAVRRLFEALARERQLVVVLDDLHWAEPAFLDLLEYIVGFGAGVPILLLGSARPELLESRPTWATPGRASQLLHLEPLSEDDVATLIEALLEARSLPEQRRARALEAAAGNPLFVEQLLAMEAEGGEITVPASLQALLTARIDRLEPGERAVIERASIEGRGFHRGAVAELLSTAERSDVGAHLLALVRKELIRPDRSEFPGDDGFRFVHILVRDAAYESMPKELRAALHERYASWLERMSGEGGLEYLEIVGYHLEQACNYRAQLAPLDDHARELALRAARMLTQAGRRARVRTDHIAAANLLSRAAQLLSSEEDARLEILPDLGEALRLTGQHAEAVAILGEAMQTAAHRGNMRIEAEARLRQVVARSEADLSQVEDVRSEVERAIRVFESIGEPSGLAEALRHLARDDFAHGRLAEGRSALERALQLAREARDEYAELLIRGVLGNLLRIGPAHADDARPVIYESLEWARARGSLTLEAYATLHLGLLEAMQGRFDASRELVTEGRAILRDMSPLFFADSATRLYAVAMLANQPWLAEEALRESYDLIDRLGERALLATHAAMLAHTLYAQARYEEAETLSKISEQATAPEDFESQILSQSVRAKLLARRGEHETAEQLAREAVSHAGATVFLAMKADALVDLAEVLRLAGRSADAVPVLEEAALLYERKGNIVSYAKARALLEELERALTGAAR